MRGFVCQHRFAGHVTDGIDTLIRGPPLSVDLDEALVVNLDARLLQTEPAAIRPPTDGNQDPAEHRLSFAYLWALQGRADAV